MILNKTTKEEYEIKVIYADNFFRRFKGLMGKNPIDCAMLFSNLKDSGIHTMFMKSEIDIYFLDKNKIVFDKTSLKPWKFYKPGKQAEYILETKINELKIKIGDELDFI